MEVIVVSACLVLSVAFNAFQAWYAHKLMERLTNPPGTGKYLSEQAANLARSGRVQGAAVLAAAMSGNTPDIDNYERIDETV